MKALILCAGLGTRLKSVTNNTPKCMVEVDGFSVLSHLINHLRKYDIEEIMVNIHHLPLKIMKLYGESVVFSYEKELLGEARTIEKNKGWLGDQFIIMNGDTLTDIDLERMMNIWVEYKSSVVSVDKGVYTGTSLIDRTTSGLLTTNFSCYWQDIGTPEGLAKARKHYESKSSSVS